MLHRERQVQDENAGAFQGKLPDGNRAFGTPMVKHASNAPKQKGLGSTRKAFSSLTNNSSQANPVTELKGQQTTARKALGDITNATPQHRPLQQAQQKATVQAEGIAGVKSQVSIVLAIPQLLREARQRHTGVRRRGCYLLTTLLDTSHLWYLQS